MNISTSSILAISLKKTQDFRLGRVPAELQGAVKGLLASGYRIDEVTGDSVTAVHNWFPEAGGSRQIKITMKVERSGLHAHEL